MKNIAVNIHINSWIRKQNGETVDPILVKMLDHSEQEIVDVSDKIRIHFDYPLTHEVTFTFEGKKPWRLSDILDKIAEGYCKIYDEEDETRTVDTVIRGTLLNRPTTNGKYGIWGHILNDLYVEGLYKKSGIWYMDTGS